MAWWIVEELLVRQLEAWPDIVGKRFLGMAFGEGQRRSIWLVEGPERGGKRMFRLMAFSPLLYRWIKYLNVVFDPERVDNPLNVGTSGARLNLMLHRRESVDCDLVAIQDPNP